MGFEHTFKTDIATVSRAEIALQSFRLWTLSNDDSKLVWESWKIRAYHIYDSVEDMVVHQFGESGTVRVRDYFPQEVWPASGEVLIHWPELPFADYVPKRAFRRLYRELNIQDALPVMIDLNRAWKEAYKRWVQNLRKSFADVGFPLHPDPRHPDAE